MQKQGETDERRRAEKRYVEVADTTTTIPICKSNQNEGITGGKVSNNKKIVVKRTSSAGKLVVEMVVDSVAP